MSVINVSDQLNKIPRIVIAGTQSGVGKTTIVTGLLKALSDRGLSVQSYKIGPDYIDPGYHKLASGKQCHNLDTWLVPEEKLAPIFLKTAAGNDLAIIEGVMGLYDGGRAGISSTAAIAKLLQAPVVLALDAKSIGTSAAAIALGFKLYDPEVNIAGVIINKLGSETHKQMIIESLDKIDIPVLGALMRNNELSTPERHLGLTPVTEHSAAETVCKMGDEIIRQVNIDGIIAIANSAINLTYPNIPRLFEPKKDIRIGVAFDEAFSFYYPESIEVLVNLGAEIIKFSPIKDKALPPVDGLIIGGGFPEMFVEQLQANTTMRNAIYQAYLDGIPIYAECGGLMYLTREIYDFSGTCYTMVGAIPACCIMEQKLQTVGYVKVTALSDNPLCSANQMIKGHEFHFSRMIPDDAVHFPWAFEFIKNRTGAVYSGGYAAKNLLASYLHMHFAGNEEAARRFVTKCQEFREHKRQEHN